MMLNKRVKDHRVHNINKLRYVCVVGQVHKQYKHNLASRLIARKRTDPFLVQCDENEISV